MREPRELPEMLEEPRWRVFRGELSGQYFAARCGHSQGDVWVVLGEKHDVTEDVERIIAMRSVAS